MTGSDAATALSLATLRTLATGLDHPEGVAVGLDGALYAGGEAGQFYRVDPESGITEELASTGGSLLGLCLDAAGLVYACDIRLNALVRLDPRSGEIDIYCERGRDKADRTELAGVRPRRLALRLRLRRGHDRAANRATPSHPARARRCQYCDRPVRRHHHHDD